LNTTSRHKKDSHPGAYGLLANFTTGLVNIVSSGTTELVV